MLSFENPLVKNTHSNESKGKKDQQESIKTQEGSKELNLKDAVGSEESSLSRFRDNPKRVVRALTAAFILLTAIGCSKEKPGGGVLSQEGNPPSMSHQEKSTKPPETRIVKRKFSGYGIQVEQTVEVDRNGNVIRVLESKTPYGWEK